MVAGVTWLSCAWVARWIPGWSLAWITWRNLAWITWRNFAWIFQRSFAWIPWWIARRNFTWIVQWSLVTWCSPPEAEIRSMVVWAVEALQMNTTIRWSLELAGSFRTKNSKRFCAWVAVVIAEPIWASSKRFCAWVAAVIAGLSWLKGSKRLTWVTDIVAELSWLKGSTRLGVALLAAFLVGCRMLGLLVLCWVRVALTCRADILACSLLQFLLRGIESLSQLLL